MKSTVIARSIATKQPSKAVVGLRLGYFVLLRSPRNDGEEVYCSDGFALPL